MLQTGLIPNAHHDLVTDAAYDFEGLHLATCSLDQRIKVWHLDESNGTWTPEHDWKAHDAAIVKVAWAHPEFGIVLASASFDRTVKVWERVPAPPESAGGPSTKWVERAMLVDAKGTVRAVEFAPHHFGLKLATIASDNCLRVYECVEQPSLATWRLAEEVDVLALPGSNPSAAPTVTATAAATPPAATLDAASAVLASHALQQQGGRPGHGTREADGGWSLSWCKDKYWGEVLAAGCGTDGVIKIIQLSPARRPTVLLALSPSASSPTTAERNAEKTSAITSIAWSPSCGRSYHLIATGGRDGHVRIWRVRPPAVGEEAQGHHEEWAASVVGDFDDHKSAVGRVEWNITGTILSSAGSDGRVRLWKMTTGNVWRPSGHISVEQAEELGDVDMGEDVVIED